MILIQSNKVETGNALVHSCHVYLNTINLTQGQFDIQFTTVLLNSTEG